MQPVRIDFTPPRGVLAVWACAIATFAAAMVPAAYIVWRSEMRSAELRAQEEATLRDFEALSVSQRRSVPLAKPPVAAMRLLQADPNGLFATIENMKEPGVQLLAVSLNNGLGTERLEYALDSVQRATSITATLNAGMPSSVWVLEGVAATRGSGASVGTSQPLSVRGSWLQRRP